MVAKTLNGEIELEGVSGEVRANTVSGRIRVEGEQIERAELRTMAGEIELDSSLAKGARVNARSFSGPVMLRLPEGTSARFDVQSYSGGIQSDFASRLDGTVTTTMSGDDDAGHSWGHGPGRPLSFVVGDGDARISIESFSGGVKIERAGLAVYAWLHRPRADAEAIERAIDLLAQQIERRELDALEGHAHAAIAPARRVGTGSPRHARVQRDGASTERRRATRSACLPGAGVRARRTRRPWRDR